MSASARHQMAPLSLQIGIDAACPESVRNLLVPGSCAQFCVSTSSCSAVGSPIGGGGGGWSPPPVTWIASAITTLPSVVQRDSTTLFQPTVKLNVPSVVQSEPPCCWFMITSASLTPCELYTPYGAASERLVPAVHQAAT